MEYYVFIALVVQVTKKLFGAVVKLFSWFIK